ncbi:MAG: fimbrillin family protein [Muribaculaceae bacterium]|nr:fimbrillin family protein [Muribaculaceae bacterium]
MKRLIYIYLAASMFVACQSGFDEPVPEPVVNANPELISITVSEEILSNDGSNSRAADVGAITSFEKGDRVGLIILDKDDNYVVRNVPYIYDGNKWAFDSVGAGGKPYPYYEKTMSTYIVYFPYKTEADNITSAEELKDLDVFSVREDQSSNEDFFASDPMTFSYTGTPTKQLNVILHHARNSFALNMRVKIKLTTGETILYHPKDLVIENDKAVGETSAFEDFYIRIDGKNLKTYSENKSEEMNYTNIAKDGSYRYILPDGFSGTFTWRYYYHGTAYGGECKVSGDKSGMRYIQDEYLDFGNFEGENVQLGDFLCKKNDIAYPLPWDALEYLNPTECVGIIIYNKHHDSDNAAYPEAVYEGTFTAESKKCHGYAIALTDANGLTKEDWMQWRDGASSVVSNEFVHTSTDPMHWRGYYSQLAFKAFAQSKGVDLATMFPAANACELYGKNPRFPWQYGLTAPSNTSGWFIPTTAQMKQVASLRNNNNDAFAKHIRMIKALLPDDCAYKGYVCSDYSIYRNVETNDYFHWTSTEHSSAGTYPYAEAVYLVDGRFEYMQKISAFCVRPMLAY